MNGIELTPEIPITAVVDLATAAEDAGFDTVLAACHYFNRDPFVALDRVAAATSDVRLGPAAANPYDTHPVVLASRVATLQETSRGRAVFGVGPGDRSTLRALGIGRARPLRRVRETVAVARELWAGNTVTHDGTFATKDAALEYTVTTPIPVYVAAQGPNMLRMAAKHADGVLINAAHPLDFEWAAEHLNRGRRDRTRADSLDVTAYVSVSIAEDPEAAREAARPPVAFIAGGAGDTTLDRHGIDRERAAEIGEHIGAGRIGAAAAAVTDRMIDAFCVAGTPASARERFDQVLDSVDGVVCAAPLGPEPDAAIEPLAEAIQAASG